MAEFNFPELIVQAKEIDKTIAFLNAKLLEPSKLGNGREARNALEEIKTDISQINNTCRHGINIRKDDYEAVLNCNKTVNDYLDGIGEILDKLESEAVQYGYETYESRCPNVENVKNGNYYLNVSGVESLSLCDPRLTPVSVCQGGNRRLQFNETISSSWSMQSSPMQSTPILHVGNRFLSSTALESWQQNANSTVSNIKNLSRFHR